MELGQHAPRGCEQRLRSQMLTLLEKVNVLQKVPMFQTVRTESLGRVAAIAQEVSFEPNQLLFREDDASDAMFVLLEGEVALLRNGQPTEKMSPHHVVGALGLLAGDAQSESAMATQPTRALQIDQQEFYDAMAEDFNITRAIMQALIHSPVATS
jgi:CRP/FNR family cyclic AMP-dependent transcriptional regulator